MSDLLERFLSRVNKEQSGCWNWEGHLDWKGYGTFSSSISDKRAHRVAYRLMVGPVPPGLVVMHDCDNRRCVNPQHLRVGTTAENNADMMRKKRHRPPNSLKVRCIRGHAFSPENTVFSLRSTGEPRRECLKCKRTRQRIGWHRRKALVRLCDTAEGGKP